MAKTNKGTNLKKLKEAFDKSNEGNVKWYKPNFGDNFVRILPSIDEEDLFFLKSGRHRIDGIYYQCLTYKEDPETGKPMKCPICEARKRLFRSGVKALIKIAKEITVKEQYLMNIVERKTDDPTTVKVWGAGVKVWKKICKDMCDDDLDITDVNDGYDFQITKEEGKPNEKGEKYPSYDTSKISRKSTSLAEDEKTIEEILENRYNFNDIVKFEEPEVLEEVLNNYVKAITSGSSKNEFYDKDDKSDKDGDNNDDEEEDLKKEEKQSKQKESNSSSAKLDKFKEKLKAKLGNDDDDDDN